MKSRITIDAATLAALEEAGIVPDFVLIAKALSGGYMPVAAMTTTRWFPTAHS